jgi:hypothetical protein
VLCRSACNASRTCGSFAWHTPSFNDPQWANGCYALHGQAWQSTAQPGVISGRGPHTNGVGYRFDAGGHQGGEGNEAGGGCACDEVDGADGGLSEDDSGEL